MNPVDLPPRVMEEIFPRILGGLALIWSVSFRKDLIYRSSWGDWWIPALVLVGCALLLVAGRHTGAAGLGLGVTTFIIVVTNPLHPHEPLALLCWAGLAVFATEGHPRDRALLIRITVTCVYAFAAITKLNPAFVGAEQLTLLSSTRPQMNWIDDLLRTPAGVAIALGTIALEAALAVALWIRRLRPVAMAVGAVVHVTFIVIANVGTAADVTLLMTLNLGLVASYVAFLCPIPERVRSE